MTSDTLWKVTRIGLHSDPDLPKDAKVELSPEDAIPLILAGKATLDKVQEVPPFELLDLARSKLARSDQVGTRILDPAVWDKIQKRVFPGGVRQYMVDGAELEWVRNWDRGLELFERRLTFGRAQDVDIFSEARIVFQKYMSRSHYATLNRQKERTDPETEILAASLSSNGRYFLGPQKIVIRKDWAKFYREFIPLMDDVRERFFLALSEGRVLMSKGLDSNSMILGAKLAARESYLACETDHYFAMSDDLPKSFFTDANARKIRMADATQWLQERWPKMLNTGRKITRKDATPYIMKKFKLSEDAAEAAIENAGLPEMRGRGAPKSGTYMSMNEFSNLK